MNSTKIEWLKGANGEQGHTWNPVTGCLHGCDYCYARKITHRFGVENPWGRLDEVCVKATEGGNPFPYLFKPTFHPYRLTEPQKLKKPSKIFVVSMGDLFGEWVPDEWINEVFKACEAAPQHTYLFLTKNFSKASDFRYRDNWWIGRTITNKEDSRELCTGDPWNIDGIHRANHFLSIEPLLGDVEYLKYYLYSFKWVIIGAQTGPGAKPPKLEWVQSIVEQCKTAKVAIFMKDSLIPLVGEENMLREFPDGLK